MTRMQLSVPQFKVGDAVWWNDPDPDGNSGPGVIVKAQYEPIDADCVISLTMDDGGEVECFVHELERL